METTPPPHEKIRFRRRDVRSLRAFPSALSCDRALWRSGKARAARIAATAIVGLVVLAAVVSACLYFAARHYVGNERLAAEVQSRITRALGAPVSASIGATSLGLDKSRFVALDISDLLIEVPDGGARIAAGSLSFGVRPRGLASGSIDLGSARLADAVIDLSGRAGPGTPLAGLGILDEDGIIASDLVLERLFSELQRVAGLLRTGDTDRLELENVTISLAPSIPALEIVSALLEDRDEGGFTLSADARASNREFALAMSFSPTTGTDVLKLELSGTDPRRDSETLLDNELGEFTLALTGREARAGEPRSLSMALEAQSAGLKIGRPDPVPVRGRIEATLAQGTDKIEFSRLDILTKRSRYRFNGAIGRVPTSQGEEPGYRYEFLSRGSTVSPEDSSEPALRLMVTVAGLMSRDFRDIRANELTVATSQGSIFGTAGLRFSPGVPVPGVDLALTVNRMPVAHAKTIWPWFAAHGARRWAMENVFAGTIENSTIRLNAEPGFFGNAVPLDSKRLGATFHVSGTRFDTTGAIPPVRGAEGKVTIDGMDIDIALSAGTVYLPSGRTVSARDGTLAIPDANRSPLIGDLRIAIEGSADAITEIAAYEPVSIDRYVDFKPDDLSGHVTGTVEARIPLQAGVDASTLPWRVDLAYEGVAIATPFEGQSVTEADGTITADRESATITADARLNGMPSQIRLVEPIGSDKSERRRNVRTTLNDRGIAELGAGLSDILVGPVTVDLAMTGTDDTQRIALDLGRGQLRLPWIGWSKGAGVPATATMSVTRADGLTRISQLALRGESFSAEGALDIDASGLRSLRLPRFALNRGDSAALRLERRQGRYDIDVSGSALDVRAIVKTVTAPLVGEAGSGAAESSQPIRVNAKLDKVSGFHGEELSGLQLAYAGTGSRIDSLRASAGTRSGAHVAVVDAEAGGNRRIEVQAGDAGAVLRFLDVYANMRSGSMTVSLSGKRDGVLAGHVDARNFTIANEKRLSSIVASAPAGSGATLNDATGGNLDGSQALFERAYARLALGKDRLELSDGVVRGPSVGSTFRGTVYDARGDMNITGTFMPAYGINRLFGDIPILGQILGNGRDGGLIGITFRLTGKAKEPQLQVNPLSAVAPGIFRSIFEFR